jgi:hypothetical protein
MTIQKTTTPYEFLIRWGKDGSISGAHVKWLDTVRDDDTIISEKEGVAIPVSLAGEAGYPIGDIFAAIDTTAKSTAESALASIALADQQAADLVAKQAEVKAAADALEAENVRLAAAKAVKAANDAQEKFDAAVAAAVAEQVS